VATLPVGGDVSVAEIGVQFWENDPSAPQTLGHAFATGDLDGNGVPDIVITANADNVLSPAAVYILLNPYP